jgi:hypothetical protein
MIGTATGTIADKARSNARLIENFSLSMLVDDPVVLTTSSRGRIFALTAPTFQILVTCRPSAMATASADSTLLQTSQQNAARWTGTRIAAALSVKSL